MIVKILMKGIFVHDPPNAQTHSARTSPQTLGEGDQTTQESCDQIGYMNSTYTIGQKFRHSLFIPLPLFLNSIKGVQTDAGRLPPAFPEYFAYSFVNKMSVF